MIVFTGPKPFEGAMLTGVWTQTQLGLAARAAWA